MTDTISTDDVDHLVQRLGKKLEERAVSTAEKKLREWDAPDYSTLEKISGKRKPGGEHTRIELTTGLAREIQDSGRYWSDVEKEAYTEENVREFADILSATANGDQALMREIYDRPHNRHDPSLQRALTTGSGATGAVTAGFHKIVSLLNTRVGKMEGIVNVIRTSENTCVVPRVSQAPVPAVYAEAASMSGGTDPNIAAVTAAPVKMGQVILMSRELLDDSPLQLSQLFGRLIGEALASLLDYHVINETPTNLTDNLMDDSTAGATVWDDNGETLTTLGVRLYNLPDGVVNNATWLINTDCAEYLVSLAGNERQIFVPFNDPPTYFGAAEGGQGTLLGRPVYVFPTSTLPANNAILGDMKAYTLVFREPMHIELDRGASFTTDQVGLHVSRRVDGIMTQATRIRGLADS